MLEEIPYSLLKREGRAYEILLLRDQYANTFQDLAKEYEISAGRVIQIYNKIKLKQNRLYINHIALALGHENTSLILKVYRDAFECYQTAAYACVYLEKKYKDVLTAYRCGEPGMPIQFVRNLPPFRPKLGEKTIARLIEMREVEKATFVKIANELHITREKAVREYDMFLFRKVMEMVRALQEKAESREEKDAIWDECFRQYNTPKKRYHMLIERS